MKMKEKSKMKHLLHSFAGALRLVRRDAPASRGFQSSLFHLPTPSPEFCRPCGSHIMTSRSSSTSSQLRCCSGHCTTLNQLRNGSAHVIALVQSFGSCRASPITQCSVICCLCSPIEGGRIHCRKPPKHEGEPASPLTCIQALTMTTACTTDS